jgi:hypothetical protein
LASEAMAGVEDEIGGILLVLEHKLLYVLVHRLE